MKTRLPVRAYNQVQRALAALRRSPGSMTASESELLDGARRATKLDDFGDDRFLEGLRVLLEAYDKEARLTPFGRMMVNGELAGVLRSRLEVQHGLAQHPEVGQARIERPLFILGLPRTGTTALHFLLAQDPANQVLEYWLAAAPQPRPPREEWEKHPRYREAARGLRMTYYLDPGLRAIHNMTVDGPEECRHLLQQSFVDETFDSNATIPSYTAWFDAQNMRPAYEHHRDVLRLIEQPTPGRRWILKYPAHMRRLGALLDVYPDACFVQTHRQPSRVLPSLCSLVAGWRGLYEGDVDRHAVGRWQLEMWSRTMVDALEVRKTLDPARFYDVYFNDVIADPIAVVRGLYGHFGFSWDEGVESRLRGWHAANPQGQHGHHEYRASDYGLEEEAMARAFAPYSEHFAVPVERGR